MIQLDLYAQWMTVVLMLLSGLTLGIAYDSYRVVAGQLRFPRWTLPCFDIFYWLGATWFVFQMLVKGNQGELRFYVFLGLALGAWLYYILLSRITVAVTNWLVKACKAVIRFLLRAGYVLIIVPVRGICIFLWSIVHFIGKSAMFSLKIVIKLAYPLWWLVRWIGKPLVMPLWQRWRMTDKLNSLRTWVLQTLNSVSARWNRVMNLCMVIRSKVRDWFKHPPKQ